MDTSKRTHTHITLGHSSLRSLGWGNADGVFRRSGSKSYFPPSSLPTCHLYPLRQCGQQCECWADWWCSKAKLSAVWTAWDSQVMEAALDERWYGWSWGSGYKPYAGKEIRIWFH